MDEAEIIQYITGVFEGIETVDTNGHIFFFYGNDHKFPWATLVTSDEYDQASDLNRPSVFRLNIGLSRETFRTLFAADSGHDFTALDQVMPHPIYGGMHWVCVLNPSAATFENKVQPLLAEAYARVTKNTTAGGADSSIA